MVYANGERLMSPWPCPPDNRVRDFNGLANPLPCLSARGHAFTGCTEVRIGSEGARRGGVTAVRALLFGVREVKTAFVRAGRRHGGGKGVTHKGVISPACPAGVVTCRYAPCAEPSVR